jgi:hypothetical protein
MVLALIRDLPAGSRYDARIYPLMDPPEENPRDVLGQEPDWYWERRTWGSKDRQLSAAILNMLGDLREYIPQWQKGRAPKHEPVGPLEWQGRTPWSKTKNATVDDAMRAFGWTGGGAPRQIEASGATVEQAMRKFGWTGK